MPPSDRVALVVQHLSIEPLDRIAAALTGAGLELVTCAVHDGEPLPASLAGVAALVVMGGPMAAYSDERFPTRRAELRLLREAVETGVATLGVCLGAQLLAQANDGRVFRGHGPELGWVTIEATPAACDDPLLAALGESFAAIAWHGDTYEPPAGAVHLARSRAYEHQAFRLGTRAWGLQFHLETTPTTLESWVAAAAATGRLENGSASSIRAGVARFDSALNTSSQTVFGAFAAVAAQLG